jgi:hypothetical protein
LFAPAGIEHRHLGLVDHNHPKQLFHALIDWKNSTAAVPTQSASIERPMEGLVASRTPTAVSDSSWHNTRDLTPVLMLKMTSNQRTKIPPAQRSQTFAYGY